LCCIRIFVGFSFELRRLFNFWFFSESVSEIRCLFFLIVDQVLQNVLLLDSRVIFVFNATDVEICQLVATSIGVREVFCVAIHQARLGECSRVGLIWSSLRAFNIGL
jgi:hypothetical protein